MEDIAAEKCGIIKPLVPVITIEAQSKAVLNVISSEAQKNQAELYVESAISDDVVLGLPGDHQLYNAALAVKAIRLLFPHLDYGALKDSLKVVSHWGGVRILIGMGKILLLMQLIILVVFMH